MMDAYQIIGIFVFTFVLGLLASMGYHIFHIIKPTPPPTTFPCEVCGDTNGIHHGRWHHCPRGHIYVWQE